MREAGTVRGRSRRSRAARCLFVGYAWIVVAFLSLPNLVVMGMSVGRVSTLEFPPRGFTLRWYERYLALPGWIDATLTSLVVGLGTAACSLVLGTLAAYALVRGRFAGRAGLRAIILLPIIVPHLVVAIALYGLFSDLRLTGTRLGFLAAHTMLATPFVVTVMVPTFQGIPVSVEQAARGLGAGRLRALWRVTLPMALPGLVASGLFAFLVSFDELLVALFLSGPEVATLPKKLWYLLNPPCDLACSRRCVRWLDVPVAARIQGWDDRAS